MAIDMDTLEATRDMVEAGNSMIADLAGQIQELDRQIDALQAEQEALKAQHQTSTTALQQTQAEVERLTEAYTQAVAFAKLAHGSIREKEAIKQTSEAKKVLATAKKALDQQAQAYAETTRLSEVRIQEMGDQLHMLRFEKETHEAELAGVQGGRDKAHEQLGTQLYQQLLAGHEDRARRVNEAQRALVDAQVQLHDYRHEAAAHLADWPQWCDAIKRLEPPDDETLRVLSATILYLEVLLKESAKVARQSPLPALCNYRGQADMWQTLLIPEAEVLACLRRSAYATHVEGLQARCDALCEIRNQYVAYLTEKEASYVEECN